MSEFAVNLGSIVVLAVVFYHVIKCAVRKAIIEAKVNEAKYTRDVANDALFLEISECLNGTDGLGTRMFDGLTKEQKQTFMPRFKEISKSFSRLYFLGVKAQSDELLRLKSLLDDLQRDVDALRR